MPKDVWSGVELAVLDRPTIIGELRGIWLRGERSENRDGKIPIFADIA